jgi:hypothetical protein
MMSPINGTPFSNAVTVVITALSRHGGVVRQPAMPVRAARKRMLFGVAAMSTKRTDWMQVVLLAIALFSIVALFCIDIYG